jgi:hypothetical protein
LDYKYKPGDRVRVIDKFEPGETHYMSSGKSILTIGVSLPTRKRLAGKVVTISGYRLDGYTIEESSKDTIWSDDMFVGLANPFTCRSLL